MRAAPRVTWPQAAPASVHSLGDPLTKSDKALICFGTINLLGLARQVGARLLLVSTSEVYSDPDVHPQPESYRGWMNTIGIRSCYNEGNRVGELPVARTFNTHGPRMLPNDGRGGGGEPLHRVGVARRFRR